MGKKKSPQLTISKLDLQLSELQTKKDELINSIRVNIKAKNEKQKVYKKYLKDVGKQIVVGCGSPGTGKSFLSFAYGLKSIKEGEFDSIKIIIPTCEASSKLSIGFLPGDLASKIMVYKEASIYSLAKILEDSGCNDAESVVKGLISEKKITFEIVSYIRGKTFDNMLILVEEAENLSSEELLLIMTRIGQNSKLVISGDPKQADRKYNGNESGLQRVCKKLRNMEEVAIVEFSDEDVVRNTLITKILKNWSEQ